MASEILPARNNHEAAMIQLERAAAIAEMMSQYRDVNVEDGEVRQRVSAALLDIIEAAQRLLESRGDFLAGRAAA